MQPINPPFSDPYAHHHHHHPQYYSHFPTQNPNPYPHHHLPFTDPDPPGVDPYYSITHNAYHAADFTYSHAPPPPAAYVSDLFTQNWAPQETAQPYGNDLYALGATVSQDVSQQLLPAIPTPSTWTNPKPTVQSWKKIPKKTKIAQSAWCEICKIACNTGDVLYKHKMGRKHIKNVEKLISAASGTRASTATSNPVIVPSAASGAGASTTTSNPVIGPLEKPKGNSGIKKKAETAQDLEVKRMKVLHGGAAANAVRTCTLCNVVCNSDTVFRFHLAGQKHASMLNKLQQPSVV